MHNNSDASYLSMNIPKPKHPTISIEEQVVVAIDSLAEHFVLFDADDRIILANKAWKKLNQKIAEFTEPGIRFEDHLRAALNKGLIPEAVGREEEWLRERLDFHRNPKGSYEMTREGGQYLLVNEQRLTNGATVLIISNITEQKRVEAELRASNERFQAFVRYLPVKMHINDLQGRYLMINSVSENLFGLSNEEASGKTADEIFSEQKGNIFGSHDREVMKTGIPSTMEEEFSTREGLRTFLTVKFPICDASGKISAVGASGIDITERKRVEHLLRKREQELSSVVESSPDNIIRYDLNCRAVFVNQKMEETADVNASSLIGKTPIEAKFDGLIGVENYQEKLQQVIRTGEPDEVDVAVTISNGDFRTHHICFVAEHGGDGEIIGALAFGRDVTESERTKEDLRIAAIALDSQEAIAITDANEAIVKINQAFTRITGYSAEEAIGNTPGQLLKSGRHDAEYYQTMWERLNREKYWEGEIWNRHKDGTVFPHRLSITAVTNDNGQITHYVAAFTDITQQKQAEEVIHNLAFFDSLTELPNRRLLQDRLQHTLATSSRNQRHGAVVFMDLDNFKELNDTKGHAVGDLLLVEVARRLQACVREDDTVARLGGDEFVIVLNDLNAVAAKAAVQAENLAEKMRASINATVDLHGYAYHGSPSIGICMFKGDDASEDELLKRADTAMYQAKQAGRNAIRFFDPATHTAMEARIALEADLRCALPEKQFTLYYQMQVNHTGYIIGAEALLRWKHPDRGLVSPLEFIPLAEETGLIISIGHWVLEAACAQLKKWELNGDTRHLQLAINVSAHQFHQPDFIEQVCAVLENTAINPHRLKFELTETMVLENVESTITKMNVLKDMGIQFAMDDFGTGYSSLAYLTRFPFSQVKIDQSFVRNIGVKSTDGVIVQTIIGMAENLCMEVIAEGVETREQRDFLERTGCVNFQGYLFGKPVPADEFEKSLLGYKSA